MDDNQCRRCGQQMGPEEAYCSACGLARTDLWEDMSGFVADGRWWRPGSEFVRRIDLEDMRQGLLRSSVLVPHGSVGVVSVDGAVEEVLSPGKRTTVTWLDRLQDLFTDKLERTSFYLVDLRPIPVPIRFEAPVQGSDATVEATATILASVDRSDKISLGTFLQAVVRERGTLDQKDLHLLLTGQVAQRVRQLVVIGLNADPEDFVGVATRVAAQLNEELGTRLGLHLDLLIDLSTVKSIDLRLGLGDAPTTRPCAEEGCGHQVPASAAFCPSCGGQQPPVSRRCAECDTVLPVDSSFCTHCGTRWAEPAATERPLFTADGEAVELDLIVRVQGLTTEETTHRVTHAAAALAAAELRRRPFAALASEQGFTELAKDLRQSLAENLASVGVKVREVAVLDLRSKAGEWLLDARSDLDQRRQQILVGREWLGVEGEELDLEELTRTVVLRRRQAELAQTFQLRAADLDARARQEELENRTADLDVRAAERAAQSAIARGDAERSQTRHEREESHRDTLATEDAGRELEDRRLDHEITQEQKLRHHAAEGERQAMDLGSERTRRSADDSLYAKRGQRNLELDTETRQQELQLEKLRQMTELDQQIAAGDHGREMERRGTEIAHQRDLAGSGLSEAQLLAVQAADLAGKEHGDAAFAALEGARVAAAREEGSQALLNQAREARQDMKDLMQTALGAQASAHREATEAHRESARQAGAVTERSLGALGEVKAAEATPAPVVAAVGSGPTTACKECGQELVPPYRFCGRCGTEQ